MIDTVMIIGEWSFFPNVASSIQACARQQEYVPEIETALQSLSSATIAAPELVVIIERWPEEWSARNVAQLLQALPITRIIVVQSAWCASAGRRVARWPVSLPVFESQFRLRLHQECEIIRGLRPPVPRTASLDEVFAGDASPTETSP